MVGGGRLGEEVIREFGMDKYTVLYLKWITNKDLLCNAGNSPQCYVAAWMGRGLWENRYTYMMAESLCCPPDTIATLLISYTPIKKKKF